MKQVNQLSKLFVQDLNRRMKIPMILVMSVLVLPVAAESKHMLPPPPPRPIWAGGPFSTVPSGRSPLLGKIS